MRKPWEMLAPSHMSHTASRPEPHPSYWPTETGKEPERPAIPFLTPKPSVQVHVELLVCQCR